MAGPKEISKQFNFGDTAISATTTEQPAWGNGTGDVYTVQSASFTQLDSITGDDSNYYRIDIHRTTSAGVHTDVVAGATFTSSNDVTGYVPYDLTLSTTAANLVVEDGEGLNVIATEVGGVNTTLSANGIVDIHLVKGTGDGQ